MHKSESVQENEMNKILWDFIDRNGTPNPDKKTGLRDNKNKSEELAIL